MLGLFHALNREIDKATSVCQGGRRRILVMDGSAIAMESSRVRALIGLAAVVSMKSRRVKCGVTC